MQIYAASKHLRTKVFDLFEAELSERRPEVSVRRASLSETPSVAKLSPVFLSHFLRISDQV